MRQFLFFLIPLSFLLSACSTPGAISSSGVEAWLDQPVNGAILPLGAFTLKAHARHAAGSGITRIEFLVNGVPVGAVDTDPSAPLAYAEATWNASAPGEYKVMARAYAGGEVADSAPAMVCVSPEAQAPVLSYVPGCQLPPTPVEPEKGVTATLPPKLTDTPWPTQTPEAAKTPRPTDTTRPTRTPGAAKTPRPTDTPQPTETPRPTDTPQPTDTPRPTEPPKPTDTPVPTSTPIPQDTTPPAVDLANVTPKVLLYGACSYDRILTVEAYASDAESGINRVFLVYRYVGVTGDFSVEMSSIGGGYYRAEVNIGDEAYGFLGGSDGSISITVVAYDGAGNAGRDSSGEVPVRYCPG